MAESLPFLSVIIPIYNNEQYLGEAIESILAEQYPALEIIAVDDGSTDSSAQIAQSFAGVVYCYQENQGPAGARNRGIELAKGEFLLFLDADDLFAKGKIRRQLGCFQQRPELEIVMGKSQFFFEDDADPSVFRFPDSTHQVHTIFLGSGMFRKSVFDKIGLFDNSLNISEDFDWFNRVREHGVALLTIDDITLNYRRHGTNMTGDLNLLKLRTIQMLKRSLDRRRENGGARNLPKLSEFRS